MNHALAIAGRELRAFFTTPISYAILTAYSVISGFFFFFALSEFFRAETIAMAQHNPAYLEQLNLNQMMLAPWIGTLGIIYIFVIPLLTMRTFAEERANGTIELLLTSPISSAELVAGKYLAVLGMLLVMTLINSVYPAILLIYGDPEVLPIAAGLLSLFLFGSALGALTCFVSSLTRSQALAAVIAILVNLVVLLLDKVANYTGPGSLGEFIRFLGSQPHFENGLLGKVYSEDLVYFARFAVIFLFLARSSVEALRWR
jgi:ABC-2 type transport system permease protein